MLINIRRNTYIPITFKQIKSTTTTCTRIISSVVPGINRIWPAISRILIGRPITDDTIWTNSWYLPTDRVNTCKVSKSACSRGPYVVRCIDTEFEVPPDAIENSGTGMAAVEFVDSSYSRCNRNVVPGHCCNGWRRRRKVICEAGFAIRWYGSCPSITVSSASGGLGIYCQHLSNRL